MSQTIASVPATLESPTDLRRFLQQLVDNIDKVLGYKGDIKYITDKDLDSELSSLIKLGEELQKQAEELSAANETITELEQNVSDLKDSVEELANVKETTQLDDAFKDLNYTGWDDRYGMLEFSALGQDVANSPMPLTVDTSYTFVASSVKCENFVYTELTIVEGTTINKFLRVGTGSTWKQLAEVTP